MKIQHRLGRSVLLTLLGSWLALYGCAEGLWSPTRGRVALTVKWPQRALSFRVLEIPEATVRIDVTIRGEGIPLGTPLQATLTPGGEENSTQFVDVPIGPKFIEAVAFDEEDRATANGATAIAVLPNTLVEARLVLQPQILPTPLPQASDTVEPISPAEPEPTPSLEPVRSIDTYAGDGIEGALDAQDPLAARFKYPRGLYYDVEQQVILVADSWHRLIRRIDMRTGAVTTLAGRAATDTSSPAGVPPALAGALPGVPSGLAVGPDGSVYFCDRENHMIRRITPAGLVETVAGTGRMGYVDGPFNYAQFAYPSDLAVTTDGVVYVADAYNNRIRRIENGSVKTVAGTGTSLASEAMGLRLPAPALNLPVTLLLHPDGSGLYVGEGKGHRIVWVDLSSGEIEPVAGTGLLGGQGEGGPATDAQIALPLALAWDPRGELLIADGWALTTGVETLLGGTSRVLRLTADGRLVRVAGVNSVSAYGYSGDTGDATQAELNNPSGLAVDASGRIFVADSYNNRIRVLRLVASAATPDPSLPTPEAVATTSDATLPLLRFR